MQSVNWIEMNKPGLCQCTVDVHDDVDTGGVGLRRQTTHQSHWGRCRVVLSQPNPVSASLTHCSTSTVICSSPTQLTHAHFPRYNSCEKILHGASLSTTGTILSCILAYLSNRVKISGGGGGWGGGPPLESSQPPLQTQDKKVRGSGFDPPSSDSCESTYWNSFFYYLPYIK